MTHSIRFAAGAERDLDSIYEYLAEAESIEAAERVLSRILEAADSLAKLPERGARPAELLALGRPDYRQLIIGPYRLIYRVVGKEVQVDVVADGRRDMQTFLARRLFGQ